MLRVVLAVWIVWAANWLDVDTSRYTDTYGIYGGSEWTRRYGVGRFSVKNRELRRFFRTVNNDEEIDKIEVLSQLLRMQIDEFRLDTDRVEIVFLVDASSSVGQENFQSELNFVRKMLSDLSVEQTATRVAIVTFSGKGVIVKNVDQISSSKSSANKCTLLNEELKSINYTGGGTYTRGALLEALMILRKSREDARKVVLLITDGFSNGGDPRPVAEHLKSLGAMILTFGIRTGNVEELRSIASAPEYTHSYFLDSFKEFEALARHALHRDVKEGNYVLLNSKDPCQILCDTSQQVPEGNDTEAEESRNNANRCCDDLAECTCGTTSGHYACLCPVGYYGSGLKGHCHPCPNGTYGRSSSPGDVMSNCVPCPTLNHVTLKVPALSPKDCICASGFITNGSNCQAITCSKLRVPENGYLVKASACSNVMNAACGLRCRIGFRLVGDSIRLCRKDGNWSGMETQCLLKTCPVLRAPIHGQVECESDEEYETPVPSKLDASALPIDARCQFKCDTGFQLLGSKVRNCLPVSRWDGLKVTCKQIRCEPLHSIANGVISPESCLGPKKLTFGTSCNISCAEGFVLEGPAVRKCIGSSGLWSQRHSVNKCVDKTPPVIECPENSTWNTVPGKRYSLPTWKDPVVVDNADSAPRVWTKPHLKFPWKAKIGVQTVTYVAQDAAGNRARCKFSITTVDKEPPQVENCADPPVFLSSKPKGADNVTWDDPVFHDNSGKSVIIRRSHHQGSFFSVGSTQVTYTATDFSENVLKCVINITVQNVCEEVPILSNGKASCNDSAAQGLQCVITCDEGYILPLGSPENSEDPIVLSCNDPNVWSDSLPSSCSLTELPESVESTGSIILESNETVCDDSVLLQELEAKIEKDLSTNLPESCHKNGLECQPSQISLNCSGILPEITQVQKRAVNSKPHPKRRRDRIEVKFKFISKIIAEHRRDPQKGIQRLRKELLSLTKSGKLNLLNERTNREIANLALNIKTLFSDEVKDVCEAGRIMRKYKCAKCPLGTFHNATKGTCQPCKLSEFQDTAGSKACKKCPKETSTMRIHSISRNDCIRLCRPGFFSKRKYHKDQKASLEPCVPCDVGFYQPQIGKTFCFPCPGNMTTEFTGSESIEQCKSAGFLVFCQPDSCFNGGTCLSDGFGFSCECPEGFVGSRCESLRNPCDSFPCLNDGTCHFNQNNSNFNFSGTPALYNLQQLRQVNSASYTCFCTAGFTGRTCEVYIDECLSRPCQNNGTCISSDNDFRCHCGDGFGGEFCEVPLDLCQPGVCEEGSTCIVANGTFKCLCKPGFLGRHCQLVPCDWLPCHSNAICVNLEEPNATHDSFRCDCPPGFTGDDCLSEIDHCESSPCHNSGFCRNHLNNFTCDCPLGFDGLRCEVKLSSDFVLNFVEPGTTDFILIDGPKENLTEFSISFWLRSGDTFNYGTVFSYATFFEDNMITLTDYNGLVFYVNGEKVVTDISLNDGFWHFLCVTWTIEGLWSIYVDGIVKERGRNLSVGLKVLGNGSVVIGQEQDRFQGGFSASESFLGQLTLLDVWRTSLSHDTIRNLFESCENFAGTLIPWSSTRKYIRGNVRILKSPFCGGCAFPNPPLRGFVNVSEDESEATYSCEPGFAFHQDFRVQTTLRRRCMKEGQWEGHQEPVCTRILCGFPGYFPRGRVFGSSFYFGDEISYACEEGYELRGNPHRVCNSDGHWSGRPPICVGVTCRNLLAPENGDIEYIIEENERDDVTILQVGQQLEFKCDFGFKLIGEKFLTCTNSGQWNFEVPGCESVGCLPPKPPNNGYINFTSSKVEEVEVPPGKVEVLRGEVEIYPHGQILQVFCNDGFYFEQLNENTEPEFLRCLSNGSWVGNVADCQPIKCILPSIPYGNVKSGVDGTIPGAKLSFECFEGYKKLNETIICQNSGNWSGEPECWPIKCPSVSSHSIASLFINKPSSGLKVDSEMVKIIHQFTLAIEGDKLGDNLILRCSDEGRELIISGTNYQKIAWMCQKDERWVLQPLADLTVDDLELRRLILSGDLCEARCPPPMIPANAILTANATEFRVNDTVTYQCRSGFNLQGTGTLTCTASGSWFGLSLCKPVSCPEPPILMNAEQNQDSRDGENAFGKVITFRCLPGYRIFGQGTSRCLASGKWSKVQGKCSKISCGKPHVAEDIELVGRSYLYREELGFVCKNGVKGRIACLEDGKWSQIPTC